MQKNEKTKKKTIEKLRMILDNPSSKDLHPEDEKHLQALSKRLEESSKENIIYIQRRAKKKGEEEIDPLKPRVTIHQREEKKRFDIPEVKHAKPEEKESLYEVEKVEVEGPEFIEVKPKEIAKEEEEISTKETAEDLETEITDKTKEPKEVSDEELPEWEPVDVKKTEVEEPTEEKPESEEELPQPVEEKKEEIETKEELKLEEEKETPIEEKVTEEQIETREEEFFEQKEELRLEEEKETPAEEITDRERDGKIDVFRDIESIDENTAVLLYNHGFTSLDDLKGASLKDLTRVTGIKRKLAKNIKKEVEGKIDESAPIVPEKEEEKEFIKKDEEINVFKGISSIDQKTAELLYENGITSVDILRETPIKKLTKIKGIRRKLAKQIKKEVDELAKKTDENEDYPLVEEDVGDEEFKEFDEKPSEQSLTDNPFIEETEDEWDSFYEKEIPEQKLEEIKGYKHGDYTLYRKKIEARAGKKRTVHFFSKGEPEDGKPAELPPGFEVKVNKKTGVPYLKKKK